MIAYDLPPEAPVIAEPIVASIRELAAIAYEDGKSGAAELHPQALRAWKTLVGDVRKLRACQAALAELIGSSDPAELRRIELGVRLVPAADEDKAAMLNGIAALLKVLA